MANTYQAEEEWLGMLPDVHDEDVDVSDVADVFDPTSTMMRPSLSGFVDSPAPACGPILPPHRTSHAVALPGLIRESSTSVTPPRLPGSDFDTFCAAESSDDADEAEVPPSIALAKGAQMRGRGRKKDKGRSRKDKAYKRRSSSSSEGVASSGSRRGELPPGWRMARDESGSRYYYNSETRQSSWTKPTAAIAMAEAALSPTNGALIAAHKSALQSHDTATVTCVGSGGSGGGGGGGSSSLTTLDFQTQPLASHMSAAFLLSVFGQWAAVAGGQLFVQADYVRFGSGAQEQWAVRAGYKPDHVAALALHVAALPLALAGGAIFLRLLGACRTGLSGAQRAALALCCVFGCCGAAAFTWAALITPGWQSNANGGGGAVLVGLSIFICQLVIAWLAFITTLQHCSRNAVHMDDQDCTGADDSGSSVDVGSDGAKLKYEEGADEAETSTLLAKNGANNVGNNSAKGGGSQWRKKIDAASGREFYYNTRTHKRQWSVPDAMGGVGINISPSGRKHSGQALAHSSSLTGRRTQRGAGCKALLFLTILLLACGLLPNHWPQLTHVGLQYHVNRTVHDAEYSTVHGDWYDYALRNMKPSAAFFTANVPLLIEFTVPRVRNPRAAALLLEDELLEDVGLERVNRTQVARERNVAMHSYIGGEHERITVVLKVYPDVLFFYTVLLIVLVAGVASTYSSALQRMLHTRHTILRGGTVGGLALLVLLLILGALQATYWFVYHAYDGDSTPPMKSATERAARTFGQLGVNCLGLLLLPIARDSWLCTALGIHWPQSLKVHVTLGYLFLVIVLCHAGLFWRTFAEMGTFPHDIFALPSYFPIKGWRHGRKGVDMSKSLPTGQDFTMPLITACFVVLLITAGVFAHWRVRRRNFELFRYTHHFHLTMVLAVLWHAPSAGYFLAGGMVMYGMQRIMQFRRVGIVQARLHIVRRHGSIGATELNFRTLNGGAIQHLPGQFVYLQIPCLSPLEWHPFSLCSMPSDSASTLLIANRGANSFERAGCFTDRLWQLAELLAASPPKQEHQVAICVDGPYGEGYDAQFVRTGGYNAVVLVAGGFGITPIISVFSALLEASEAGQLRGVDVDLIWCNPRPAFFAHTSFARIFALARNNERFSVSLFATQERLPAQGKLQHWNCHRPDWPTQLDSARRQAQAGSVLCLVSGPREMVDELSVVSLEAGFDFRAISFDI